MQVNNDDCNINQTSKLCNLSWEYGQTNGKF